MKGSNTPKRIWVDLDNSPHVPFFKPIIATLRGIGYGVVVTARDCFQVKGLTRLHGLSCKTVGRHYGKNKILKVGGLIVRAAQLAPFVISTRPNLALSHGSRAQILIAAVFRVPTVVIADYEHTQKVLTPTRLVVPEMIPDDVLGVTKDKVCKYPGIKEDVYVTDFRPDNSVIETFGLDPLKVIVTIRPPATEAHYHNPASEILLNAVMEHLARQKDVQIVLLPRTEHQGYEILSKWKGLASDGKLLIPEQVVDGLNLIWYSDLVISGGGTMNREAAALGVPVYSIFRGKIGAVDRHLAEHGRLVLLESAEDIRQKLLLQKRNPIDFSNAPRQALNAIVECVVDMLEGPTNS